MSKDKVLMLFLLATLAIGHTKDILWFATEARQSLYCPGIEAAVWYYNGAVVDNSPLFTISQSGTLWVNEITLNFNNAVFRCEGPSGAFEYHVHVEVSTPAVGLIYLEDKDLCWEEPQTFATIAAYYVKIYNAFSHIVLWHSNHTTGTCITLEDMPLNCLSCGNCRVNITVEFSEDTGQRNGSTSTNLVVHDSEFSVSIVDGSVQADFINATTTSITINLNKPVCSLSAHFNGTPIQASWSIVNSNYTNVSLLLTNTEGQTGSLSLEVVHGNHTSSLPVPISFNAVITDSAVASTRSTEGRSYACMAACAAISVPTLLVAAGVLVMAVVVAVIYLQHRKGKKGDQDITHTEDTTESLDPPKERDRLASVRSCQYIKTPDTNTETLEFADADTSYEVPTNVGMGEQESQPSLATRSAGEENAVNNIQEINGEVQPFSITSAPVEYTAIQMGLEYSEIQQLNAPCESVSAASSPCTPVHCSDMAFPSHCLVSPSLRSSAAGIPVAENIRVNTSLPPHYNNTVQGSSVEEDHHNDKMMETTPRTIVISMEHLETSVYQTTADSSDEGVAASPPTTPIDCSDTTPFPFHCRVSPSVGSSYGASPPASNLPADSSLAQSSSVKKDHHNNEKPEYVGLPKNTSSTTLQQLASCKTDASTIN